jgi:betaine-homocysteine S-methyltransferase
MMPYVKEIRDRVKIPVAALPVPYRTTTDEPTFESLTEKNAECAHCNPQGKAFPVALDPFMATRFEIAEFGKQAVEMDVRYIGVCCGAGPHHIRALAEAIGRKPPSSRFSPDMSKHYALGNNPQLKQQNREYAKNL